MKTVFINPKLSNMKSIFLTVLFLLITKFTFAQSPVKTYYSFTFGTNIIDNNNNVDYLIPFIKQGWSYNTPFFVAAERNFNFDPNFSVSALLSTNQLEIDANNKNYIAVDVLGKYNFNKLLFDSKKIELSAGLGLGRYFLDKKGSNTFNFSGGMRYWFSNQFGLDGQLIGKYGLQPVNRDVMNHYQLNFGFVWRSLDSKIQKENKEEKKSTN